LHSLYTFLTILSLSIWSRWIQNIIMFSWCLHLVSIQHMSP